MKNHDLYYQYNPWWETNYCSGDSVPRPKYMKILQKTLRSQAVIILTGLRRVGKTTLMKQIVQLLIAQGSDPKHLFYVSIDDYQLRNLNIAEIITEYRKIHRLTFTTKINVFLDEITYQPNFNQQLKNLYDKQSIKVFASSSSSSVLRDKQGALTGRKQIIEILPLDFHEYLNFKKIKLQQRDAALLESYFIDYLQFGGMPEYILKQNREYLSGLIEDILYKDIVALHSIRKPRLIKDFFHLLMERCGKQISTTKIANILKISPDTAQRYLHMFMDTYLVSLVPRYGKTNETILAAKKIYAADLGIRNLFTGFRDKGALFENIVYTLLKPLKPQYVYQNGIEIDFMTENKILVEVKYGSELTPKQQALFEQLHAHKKLIVRDFSDLAKLENLIALQ